MPETLDFLEFQVAARAAAPRVGLILGSGLSGLIERLGAAREVPFAQVPGLSSEASVAGHRGTLLLGTWLQRPVLVFAGRLHYYEGHPWSRVLRPVQLAHELGIEALAVTNAAGGIRHDLAPGSLLALRGHLDCTRPFWWRSEARITLHNGTLAPLAHARGIPLLEGVYAQVTGPSYETPAEVRALRACGADAVGMSTAREIEAAMSLGMRCYGLSCITNSAAGLAEGKISHDEVLEINARSAQRLGDVLESVLPVM